MRKYELRNARPVGGVQHPLNYVANWLAALSCVMDHKEEVTVGKTCYL